MEGNSHFDEDLSLHMITGMVLPGDGRPILMALKEVEAHIQKHLRCVASVILCFMSYKFVA